MASAVVDGVAGGLGINPMTAKNIGIAMAEGFSMAMASQGLSLLFGLEKKLNWCSVVAQTIGAGIARGLHGQLHSSLSDTASFP